MERITEIKQPQMEINFSLESWEDIKSKDFDILSSGEDKKHILQKLGYDILKSGDLVDVKTKKRINIFGSTEFVNLDLFSNITFVSGSHNFVKNLIQYSKLLAERDELKFVPSTKNPSVN